MPKDASLLYILGAGASYEKIPVVGDFVNNEKSVRKDKLLCLKDHVKSLIEYNSKVDLFHQIPDFDDAMNTILEEAINHHTIDTLSKKYLIRGDQVSLNKLKKLIETFLIRLHYNGWDKRYDVFWANFLQHSEGILQLNRKINIISWNYDFQLEMALTDFTNLKSINETVDLIKNDLSPYLSFFKMNSDFNNVSIFDWDFFRRRNSYTNNLYEYNLKVEGKIFKDYLTLNTKGENNISSIYYSCESSDNSSIVENRINALNEVQETKTVVVVGYSFPNYNREKDVEIFKSIKKGPPMINGRKFLDIYLQVHEDDMTEVTERLQIVLEEAGYVKEQVNTNKSTYTIIPWSSLQEFVIPPNIT